MPKAKTAVFLYQFHHWLIFRFYKMYLLFIINMVYLIKIYIGGAQMNSEQLSLWIYNLRKANNLTQKEFGDRIGVSNRAVSKWENGISMPSTETFLSICNAFSVPADCFSATESENKITEKIPTGMQSVDRLYRIGRGPSSSHTIGPERICKYFLETYPDADKFKVVLYGSLAKTGVGHGTDTIIKKTLAPKKVQIDFDYSETNLEHPNTMEIFVYKGGNTCDHRFARSIGGGEIEIDGVEFKAAENIYDFYLFSQIADYCKENKIRLWQYVEKVEGKHLWDFLAKVWQHMKDSIEAGVQSEGTLPGGLNVKRKAKHLYSQNHIDETVQTKENRMVCAYAFAVSEQNAAGETIVTAPTCGAGGVLPAVLYYYQQKRGFSDEEILYALATASVIGNLVKTNASISGAECGCQAEVGTACSMASAALAELFGMDIDQIEYAAEIAIEHHLGLTCDPICGLVQIPCIERNAVAAMRAINAVNLANFLTDTRKISLDLVIRTMYETGKDLSNKYRETAMGGLARLYEK